MGNLISQSVGLLPLRVFVCAIQQEQCHGQHVVSAPDYGRVWRVYNLLYVCQRKCTNAAAWKHLGIYRLCGNKRCSRIGSHCLGLLDGKIVVPYHLNNS